MTALSGQSSISPLGGYINPRVSADLSAMDFTGWPPALADMQPAGTSYALTRNIAQAHPRARDGQLSQSYVDDYYNRIHIRPLTIDLGNLVTSQTRTVEVWNAWRASTKTLSSVTQTNASGINVTAPAALPMDFAPLQSRIWQVQVTTDGSPTIAAAINWLFAGIDPIAVEITGQRLTAWTVTPDWSSHGITETLSWLTDVQEAVDGSSQRVVDRETPRRQWEFDVLTWAGERQSLESTLAAWRARNWALPVWPDQTVLSEALPAGSTTVALATAGLDFAVGGLAILHASARSYELLEVNDVGEDAITFTHPTQQQWQVGTRLWPCRLARITDTPKYSRKSSEALRTTVRFESTAPNDWPAIAPVATYLGIPVLEDRTDESPDPTASPDRQLDVLDGNVGAVYVADITGLPWTTQSHAWWLVGRSARAAQRSLLYWMQGRANALWLPSWCDDITLIDAVPDTSQTLTVQHGGFSQFAVGLAGHQHIRIERNDGTVEYRGVTGAAVIDAQTEQLSINSALSAALDPADVRQISWMMLGSLGKDDVEIDHVTDSEGLARCRVGFTALPAEEPTP